MTSPALGAAACKQHVLQGVCGHTDSSWPQRRASSPGWHSLLCALLQLSDLLLHLLWLCEVTHEVEIILCIGPMNVHRIVNPQLL